MAAAAKTATATTTIFYFSSSFFGGGGAFQSSVDRSLFQNCPPRFLFLLLTFPVPQAHVFRSSSTDSSHFNISFSPRQVPIQAL